MWRTVLVNIRIEKSFLWFKLSWKESMTFAVVGVNLTSNELYPKWLMILSCVRHAHLALPFEIVC